MRSLGTALAALAVLLFPACGGQGRAQDPDHVEDRGDRGCGRFGDAFPSIDMADLAAGTTYTTQQFKPNITLPERRFSS